MSAVVGAAPRSRRAPRMALLAQAGELLGPAVLALAVLFVLLQGWRRDFHVPLSFSHDALEYLMQVKGTVENGWWWSHPRLSAPTTFQQIAYPSNTNVDQALVWIVRLFTRDASFACNVSWMVLVALSATIAARCLITLGLSRPMSFVAGVLFALSPYALYRNVEHFALVIYLVPIPCTVALLIATGRLAPVRARPLLLLGCALLGFDYAYYAFFGCFVILAAAVIGWFNREGRRALGHGVLFIAVISAATAVNLVPSFLVWAAQGKPIIIPDKTPAEAEVYGLKIRQLVSPTYDHTLTPFRAWTDRERAARYPLETENTTSRLGALATLGFLALLTAVFAPHAVGRMRDGALFVRAGLVTLATVLLGTIGGFGSVFNLLVSPEIRSYNRLCPFIAFLSWVALGLVIDQLCRRPTTPPEARPWAPVALAGVLLLGVYDQGHAVAALNRRYAPIREEIAGLRWFVDSLEQRLPAGAMVFQLPVTTYLNDGGRARMLPYDHIKPYVVSRTVHWSYPAIANATVRWQHEVGRLTPGALTAALQANGFAAIVIDRYGYEDGGQALLTELGGSGPPARIAESGRYVALDVAALPKSVDGVVNLPAIGADFGPATFGLARCAEAPTEGIDEIGSRRAPFGDTVPVFRSGTLTIRGWAVDDRHLSLASDVDVVVDNQAFGTFYGIDRGDIAARFDRPAYRPAGFIANLPARAVAAGPHTLAVRVLASNRGCFYESPGIRLIAQ
jgi:hypothetical protein